MLEVISSILDAERQSDSIIKQADEKSKANILSAESQAEGIKSAAIEKFKNERSSKIMDAESIAENEYNIIVDQGRLQANNLKESVSGKIASVVDFVVENIIK
jgi:vacuolar-type H+-ATPase subunit H